MKVKIISTLTLGLLISVNALSQSRRVVDMETNLPIPYVNIYSPNTSRGTVSNDAGEFEWSGASADSLVISHLSYETQRLMVRRADQLIKLKQRTTVLSEVVVSDFGRNLATKAYQAALKCIDEKNYGKAFYRQITRNDNVPIEVQEIFYTVELNNSGVLRSSIEEARYAQKQKKDTSEVFVRMGNISYLVLGSGAFSTTPAEKKQMLVPFMPAADSYYSFSVIEKFTVDGEKFVKIHFEPNDDLTKPATYGEFTVSESNLMIRNISLLTKNSLGNDTLKSKKGKWLTFNNLNQLTFDFLKNGQLNYIKYNGFFEYADRVKKHKVEVESFLFVYEQLNKSKSKLHAAEIKSNDLTLIRKKKYNAKFWRDNPIVKRTPLQEEITNQFEKDGAFGTMFKTK